MQEESFGRIVMRATVVGVFAGVVAALLYPTLEGLISN